MADRVQPNQPSSVRRCKQRHEKKSARADPAGFIRDRAAYKQSAEAEFLVMRALDVGRQLDDLAAFGFVAQPDGTYRVDLQKFPQWNLLAERLGALEDLDSLDRYVPALKARGFRNADVEALRTYVATHDPRQFIQGEGKELIGSFAKRVQKRHAAGQPPDFDEAMDFRYQVESLKYEAQRQWAIGLMDTLDRQRERILVSPLEQPRSNLAYSGIREPLNEAWLQLFQLMSAANTSRSSSRHTRTSRATSWPVRPNSAERHNENSSHYGDPRTVYGGGA